MLNSHGENPYSLVFGREPDQFITRDEAARAIIDTFSADTPSQQAYMITGIRGSGKTVFLTSLSDHFKADKNWVCVELGTQRDMLSGLAAKLASQDTLAAIFRSAKINLSLFGFGLEVSGTAPIADVESALEKMLASMARHGKKLLICVDEVVTSDYLRAFCSAFQIFVREKLPVFLLMTGLYENIETLRNTPNLTFLYRATRVSMDPLSRFSIADSYQRMFSLSRESALEMASWTKGYSFACQVLGYYTWEHGGDPELAYADAYQYLAEYSYIKIWSDLSSRDRDLAEAIARSENNQNKEIRELLGWTSNQYNPYRMRLIRKGLVDGQAYGHVFFVLPEFGRFVLEYSALFDAE